MLERHEASCQDGGGGGRIYPTTDKYDDNRLIRRADKGGFFTAFNPKYLRTVERSAADQVGPEDNPVRPGTSPKL